MIFASCRCLDMAKLVDAAKQFTTLYGKEFLSTTIVMLHEKCLSLFTFYLCFYSYTLKYYFRYVTKFNMNYCCSNLHLSQFFQSMCVYVLRYATSKAIIYVVWFDEIIFGLKLDSIIILCEIYEEHWVMYASHCLSLHSSLHLSLYCSSLHLCFW